MHTSPSSTYRISVSLIAFASICCFAQTNVLTYRNDNMRTAQNLSETMLTTANVKPASFGLLYNFPVDGQVYAQPLVVSRLNIGSMQSRNVVFVATEGDSIYAFDAQTGATYWGKSLLGSSETTSIYCRKEFSWRSSMSARIFIRRSVAVVNPCVSVEGGVPCLDLNRILSSAICPASPHWDLCSW